MKYALASLALFFALAAARHHFKSLTLEWRPDALTPLAIVLTDLGNTAGMTLLSIFAVFILVIVKRPRDALTLAVIMILGSSLNAGLKIYYQDARPDLFASPYPASGYSFPSGHAQAAVAFYGTLALLFRRRWFTAVCILMIFAICWCRLHLAVHRPTDLLGGGLVAGFAISFGLHVCRGLPIPRGMRAAFLLPLLAVGCLGGTQNPAYFPSYLPAGDIIRTHAKPAGRGYFRNFDPKACKIEITPANQSNPVKAQVVLIATVYDKDGDARRKRRVEWQLEGPGTIVEVDESGVFAGRGYQITDKYAVSYTDLFQHTLTRGSEQAKDEINICAGQTWCVVSSPVPGETVVTAYAPEVYDWNQRRAFARLVWGDGGFQPAIRSGRETDSTLRDRAREETASLVLDAKLAKSVAVNRETTATIQLTNNGKAASAAAQVRAVVPDGVEIVRSDPAPSRRNGRDLYWNLDSLSGGVTKDVALVLRPTRSGAFILAAAAETTDGLTASTRAESHADTAAMTVKVENGSASTGDRAVVDISVTNTGNVPIENAVAWVTPSGGLTSSLSPLEVKVGSLPPGQSRTVDAALNADRGGKGLVRVDVTADGGLSARGEGNISISRAELQVRIVGPEMVPVGDTATYEVQVTNAGDVAVKDVDVQTTVPRGLSTTGDTSWRLANLAPGERKIYRLAATGDRLSELGSVSATARGSLTNGGALPIAKTSAPASVQGLPVLTLEVTAPSGSVAVGGRAAYRITLRNRGSGPARDVTVSANVSSELRTGRTNFDRIAELAPGATKTFTLDAEAVSAGDARVSIEVASKDLPTPLKEEQGTRVTTRK